MNILVRFKVCLIIFILISGCAGIQNHKYCMQVTNTKAPADIRRDYDHTETVCNSSGVASPTTTNGDQYVANGSTRCISKPIYRETIFNCYRIWPGLLFWDFVKINFIYVYCLLYMDLRTLLN
jgi:uncharacterized protein YceK